MQAIFTSHVITEGHPEQVSDLIADSILNAHLTQTSRPAWRARTIGRFVRRCDLRPVAMCERLALRRQIHRLTTSYGHSSRTGPLWEE